MTKLVCKCQWAVLLKYGFMLFQINSEFKRIATMSLQSRFLSQLDLLSASLDRGSKKSLQSGKQGKKLKDMAVMMTVRANY